MEQWKDIPDYEGLYQASNTGHIRTCKDKVTSSRRYKVRHWKQKIIKEKWQERENGRKDARVELWKDGEHKTWLVARLVALTWVDGYEEGMTVNHKNGDTTNNNATNLEWLTRSENIKHGYEHGLYKSVQSETMLIRHSDGVRLSFPSMASASRYLGRNTGYVSGRKKNGLSATDAQGRSYSILAGSV